MAIFIDRRPKLDKAAIIMLIITLVMCLSGLKGCRSDYAKDKLTETSTAVRVTDLEIVGETKYLHYEVGEHTGQISVTDETFKEAKIGKIMRFRLSKSDYEGSGWLIPFGIMIVIGGIGVLISLGYTIATIYNRYF